MPPRVQEQAFPKMSAKDIKDIANQHRDRIFPKKTKGHAARQTYRFVLLLKQVQDQRWDIADFLRGLPAEYKKATPTDQGFPQPTIDALGALWEEKIPETQRPRTTFS
jgi:hypothetical protein